MSFWGGGGGGDNRRSRGNAQTCGQNCGNGQCSSQQSHDQMQAGGALGQVHHASSGTTSQPGMELMPTGFGNGRGSALASITGGRNAEEIQQSLKGAPPDVLAAAERLSLIPTTTDPTAPVIRSEPGPASTDTGKLSVSALV